MYHHVLKYEPQKYSELRPSKQFHVCLFYFIIIIFFFLQKDFTRKAQKANQATFTLLEACVPKKPLPLLFFARLYFVLLANVCL